jgi:hypothetical protein
MSRIIEIKKSQVAFLRGLNKTVEQMCSHFGVTEKEMKAALTEFGFIKTRKPKNYVEPEYVVKTINDVYDDPNETETVETQVTDNQVVTDTETAEELSEIVSSSEN